MKSFSVFTVCFLLLFAFMSAAYGAAAPVSSGTDAKAIEQDIKGYPSFFEDRFME